MKKILFAAALLAIGVYQTNAQQPAPGNVSKESAQPVKAVTPAQPSAKPALAPAAKPNPKIAPASVRKGKQVTHRDGTHGKKRVQPVKTKSAPVKPVAPGTDEKK